MKVIMSFMKRLRWGEPEQSIFLHTLARNWRTSGNFITKRMVAALIGVWGGG